MVLPVALVLLMITLAAPRLTWANPHGAGLCRAVSGPLPLFIFGVLLALAYVVVYLWPGRGRTLQWRPVLLNGAVAGLVALVVTLPWNVHLWGGFGGDMAREVVSGYDPARHGSYFNFVWPTC